MGHKRLRPASATTIPNDENDHLTASSYISSPLLLPSKKRPKEVKRMIIHKTKTGIKRVKKKDVIAAGRGANGARLSTVMTRQPSGFLKFENFCEADDDDGDGPVAAAAALGHAPQEQDDRHCCALALLLMASSSLAAASTGTDETSTSQVGMLGGRGRQGKSLKTCLAVYKSRQNEKQVQPKMDCDSVSSGDVSTLESMEASSSVSSFYGAPTASLSRDTTDQDDSANEACLSATVSFSLADLAPTVQQPLPPMVHVASNSAKFDTLSAYAATLLSATPRSLDVAGEDEIPLEYQGAAETDAGSLHHLGAPSYTSPWSTITDEWKPGHATHLQFPSSEDASGERVTVLQAEIALQRAADKSKFRRWSEQEDELLRTAVQIECQPTWPRISFTTIAVKYFGDDRNCHQCKSRWRKIRPGVNREHFTREEDETILDMQRRGIAFAEIAKQLDNRTTEQVRAHFNDKLDPHLDKRKKWTFEEEAKLFDAQKQLGNKWVAIAKLMPGRSENDVKNKWHNSRSKQRRHMRRAMAKHVFETEHEADVVAEMKEAEE